MDNRQLLFVDNIAVSKLFKRNLYAYGVCGKLGTALGIVGAGIVFLLQRTILSCHRIILVFDQFLGEGGNYSLKN